VHRTVAVVVLPLVVSFAGCKKPREDEGHVVKAKMKELTSAMCACVNKACADHVQETLTRWSTDLTKKGGGATRPSEAEVKELTEIGDKYAECMIKAMTVTKPVAPPDPPAPPPGPPSPPPTKPDRPAAAPSPATVDQLLALARDWAGRKDDTLRVVGLAVHYVDAEGQVDDEDGEVTFELGTGAQGASGSKRRLGAPVKAAPAPTSTCRILHWTRKDGWWTSETTSLTSCPEARPPFPRCTVPAIWKRAIAKGAPAEALAVLRLEEATPRQWSFAIVDEPRGIDIKHRFADDCDVAVEKP